MAQRLPKSHCIMCGHPAAMIARFQRCRSCGNPGLRLAVTWDEAIADAREFLARGDAALARTAVNVARNLRTMEVKRG